MIESNGLQTRLRTWARLIEGAPEQFGCASAELWRDWFAATTPSGRAFTILLLLILATVPVWGGTPLITTMIAVLWLAYAGQTWNLLAGFAGLFSLGHALFIGVGGYLAALFALRGGLGAGLSVVLALPTALLVGAAVGALGCRAGLKSAHFTVLTLILAETARLGASHLDRLGGAAGLSLPQAMSNGKPVFAYYSILGLTGLALVTIRLLLRSRLGYHWLAVREDAQAAAASGINIYRAKIWAVAVSAALAAPAGVFLALSLHQADPGHMLSFERSLAPLLGAAIGGIGTLVGPVLGAFVVVPLDQALSWLITRSHHDLSALKPIAAGLALVLVAMAAPGGLWPGFAHRLRLLKPPASSPSTPP